MRLKIFYIRVFLRKPTPNQKKLWSRFFHYFFFAFKEENHIVNKIYFLQSPKMPTSKRTPEIHSLSFNRNNLPLELRSGLLAPQADGAIEIRLGENVFLATAVMQKNPDENKDFLPLTIDFRESYSAAGKIG